MGHTVCELVIDYEISSGRGKILIDLVSRMTLVDSSNGNATLTVNLTESDVFFDIVHEIGYVTDS